MKSDTSSSISSARSSLAIIMTFLVFISVGTFCLLLPFAVKGDDYLTFQEALFTATSCSCVTGLSIIDVYSRLSNFGLIIQMLLSQIGGIGIITVVSFFMVAFNQRISQKALENAKNDSGSSSTGNLRSALVKIIRFVGICEAFFVITFFFVFLKYMPFGSALFNSFYHTIMSFCNSGFMIFENAGGLEVLQKDIPFKVLTIFSMFIGSVGFFVFDDFFVKKGFKHLTLNSKMILIISVALIVFPSILMTLVTERGKVGFLDSVFMCTTCRTTGMTIVNFESLNELTYYVFALLMFIGGAPGSMAGGLKVSTLAALIISIRAIVLDTEPNAFRRRISWDCINKALAVLTLFILTLLTSVFVIKAIDTTIPVFNVIFDAISAISTTGLSLSVGAYSLFCNYLLCFLMFLGRIGPFTIASLLKYTKDTRISYVVDDLVVG